MMGALFLSESDVERLVNMELAIEAESAVFRRRAEPDINNIPRGRARTEKCMLHVMGAASNSMGVACSKIYTSSRGSLSFLVLLHDGGTGELLAVLEGNRLGAVRTGAVSAVATDLMARPDSNTVGIFGSGRQARTQLEAVCFVRDIVEAYVYSPNSLRRTQFAEEMSSLLGIDVVPVAKPELAAEDKDIVITATTSATPVLKAEWISEGTHLNAVGSNFLAKAELDTETIRQCKPIVVDDKEQSKIEAGDFTRPLEEGVITWQDIHELSSIVHQRLPGRTHADDITLFKSVGAAFEDLAIAKAAYELALREGVGNRLPF
ncbi:MAG: ornithine cyclodeaminase family protein [Planctomycetota bacterium]